MAETNDKISLFNFELLGRDIKIDFTKHLTKKDKELFRHINLQKYNHIPLLKFFQIYSLNDKEEVIKFLNNLINKNIIISSKETNYFTYISIIQSYYINNNIIYLVFSDEITSSFKNGSFFDKLGLRNILFLEEKFSYRLYQFIYNSKEEIIYIPLEKLREILEIGETYQRFYDIEKNLLLPILEDIKKNGGLDLEYQKIKNGEHKSAKILGINIIKKGYPDFKKNNDTSLIIDNLMLKLGNNIKNFSEIYSLLRKNLAEYGEEFIKSKVDYVLKNFNDNIEENLKKLLTEKSIERKPDYTLKKSFKNLFELHSEILHYLHKNNLSQLSTYMFLVKLYTLKDQGTLLLTDKNLTIKVQYNKDSESEINFFINK